MITSLGSKNGSGVHQAIINNMPPHKLYIEPFVGSGAILLRKKPALASIVIDADPAVARHWSAYASRGEYPGLVAMRGDCRVLIDGYCDDRAPCAPHTLVYCDPPYVCSARRSKKTRFKHDFTEQDHQDLLWQLRSYTSMVMISGYRCDLYDTLLSDWRRVDIRTRTRGGDALESLWCNFERPSDLHDLRYLGANYRERERVKRKKLRWVARLAKMDPLERRVLLEALLDLAPVKPEVLARTGGGGR